MVSMKSILTAVSALALVASPTLAVAQPVAAPATESVKDGSDLAGGGLFVALIAAVAVIVGIVIIADNNDKPNSP